MSGIGPEATIGITTMDCLRIAGGVPLDGQVAVNGAKNAALPIMAAALLADGPVSLARVPRLVDVTIMARLLRRLGVDVARSPDDTIHLQVMQGTATLAHYDLVRQMRASFCVLGPLVARRGRAMVSLPGGCNIGSRPVDLHLRGLQALGAELRIERGYVVARARRLRGAQIDLSGPSGSSVTGTANVLSAAVLARGRTTITSAAREPEIVDLGNFLVTLGARIEGLGTSVLEIDGVEALGRASYRIIPDRIEAGTLLIAAAIAGGQATVTGACASHLGAVLETLTMAGVAIEVRGTTISACMARRPRPFSVDARPYPGVPTDLQAQLLALAALAEGVSQVRDSVFPERFRHIDELVRLGARVTRRGPVAIVEGVSRLSGAVVTASDLRASAALVLAGLNASHQTIVRRAIQLDRGYDRLDEKLAQLGAQVERVARQPQLSGGASMVN